MIPGFGSPNQQLDLAEPVNPSSEDQSLSGSLSNRSADDRSQFGKATAISERWVREPEGSLPPAPALPTIALPPAHPSNRTLAQLNDRWRIVDDPLQWILQQRKGNSRKKNSGWQNRSFCRTRGGLLRCVREKCGEVHAEALARLQALPKFHCDGMAE